jgi:hypothetical protein
MTLPVGDAISRTGYANLRMVEVAKTDIKHYIPAALPQDLAAGHTLLLPFQVFLGFKDGIILALAPV